MKYTMQLISRDELKRTLERKDQLKLVMALGTGSTVQNISLARCTSSRCRTPGPRSPRMMRLSSTVPTLRVLPASSPTSTWYITATSMCAAMRAAFSTGRRPAIPSRERWSLQRPRKQEEGGGCDNETYDPGSGR